MVAAWEQLVKAALLGTERGSCQPLQVGGAAGPLVAQIQAVDAESQLLSTAAILSTYCRAGWMPAQMKDVPTACEAEELPVCNPRAADHLGRMLAGEHRIVLPEWLAALDRAGGRVPPRYLPALLDLGRSDPKIRELVAKVAGRHGQWLIRHNPDWQYAADLQDSSLWETGSADARAAVLCARRLEDPAAGRQMLASTWEQEPPEQKARLLETFQVGLSMEDEPFLEQALDQKRKEVRKVAAELLAKLPQSRLSQRMLQRVRPLIQISQKRKLLGLGRSGVQIEVTLPAACDKAMRRDGIEPKPRLGIGEKTWWLQQMIGVVPPAIFSDELGAEPGDLISAASRHEFADALLWGWTAGCQRHPEPRWAEALILPWLDRGEIASQAHDPYERDEMRKAGLRRLAGQMARESREAIALRAVEKACLSDSVLAVLSGCEGPWSVALTRVVTQAIRVMVRGGLKSNVVAAVHDEFGLHMDPSLAQEISQDWPRDSQTWQLWSRIIEQMLAVLQFRHEMLKEIGQ